MKITAIIRTELWQRRRALLFWSLGVAALVGIDMLLYTTVKGQAQDLNRALSHLPLTFKSLFADNADFLSPAGFLSARVYYLLLPLVLTIFTIGLGSSLIGKEEQQGTLELLLSRPVSRLKLLLSKITAGTLATALLALVALVVGLICLKIVGFDGVSARAVAFVTLEAVILSSLFGAIALCLSSIGGPFRNMSTGVAALIAFSAYLLASLENVASWIAWPARLLPYHYYHPSAVLEGSSYGLKPMLGYFIIAVGLLVCAWAGFRRRDIG